MLAVISLTAVRIMIPIEVERHDNIVTVTTDTKKRMYAVVHLAVPAGFDPSDFDLSRAGANSWELVFENVATAHRFKRLMDEAGQLVGRRVQKLPRHENGSTPEQRS